MKWAIVLAVVVGVGTGCKGESKGAGQVVPSAAEKSTAATPAAPAKTTETSPTPTDTLASTNNAAAVEEAPTTAAQTSEPETPQPPTEPDLTHVSAQAEGREDHEVLVSMPAGPMTIKVLRADSRTKDEVARFLASQSSIQQCALDTLAAKPDQHGKIRAELNLSSAGFVSLKTFFGIFGDRPFRVCMVQALNTSRMGKSESAGTALVDFEIPETDGDTKKTDKDETPKKKAKRKKSAAGK